MEPGNIEFNNLPRHCFDTCFTLSPCVVPEKLEYSIGKFAIDSLIFAGACILYVIVGVINAPQYSSKHHIPDFLFFPGEKIWISGLFGLIPRSPINFRYSALLYGRD